MIKYLFLLLLLVGCSNNSLKNMSKSEKQQFLILKAANLYSKGKTDEALENYQKVLKLNSKELIALRETGIILADKGEFETAENYLLKALKQNPNDIYTLRNLGYLEFKKGDLEKSYNYLNKINSEQREPQEIFIMGYYFYKKKEYQKALHLYQNIVDEEFYSNKQFFDSYLDIVGNIKSNQQNILRELENYSLDKKDNIIKLANLYSKRLKKRKEAISLLKRYMGYNSVDIDILQILEREYKAVGDTKNSEMIKKMIKNKSFNKN